MKTKIKLTDFLGITNFEEYKVHLAFSNGEEQPLDLFYNDYESWISWNEYFSEKNDFNREYIIALVNDYNNNNYLFAGIFRVVETHYGEKYVIEELEDYEEYKGRLVVPFKRYQGLRGRAFKLETLCDSLYVSEIIENKPIIKTHGEKQSPNIFDFATSELSQDAMFSWLIQWADDSNLVIDKELCNLGKLFVSELTGIEVNSIHNIEVERQWKNIDIIVDINDNAVLVIEDKTGTTEHDDQLRRYKETVEKEYANKNVNAYYAYIKTESEPINTEIRIQRQGYKVFNRTNLLNILYHYRGNNPLVIDYRNHLQKMEDAAQSFLSLPVNDWTWYAWQGFYKSLEQHLDIDTNVDSWNYVANPTGGFLGFWWHFRYNYEVSMYLQFEQSKLCVKIEHDEAENKAEIRWKYHSLIIDKSKELGLVIEKPARFRPGTYMTIGVLPVEYIFGDGIIDMPGIIKKLNLLETLIDNCICN